MPTFEQTERAIAGVDFDVPFELTGAGEVRLRLDLYGPSVFHDETGDIEIDGKGWSPLGGYTGQYGYNGAVMHASETVGGGLLRDMIADPGVYVLTVVEVWPDDEEEFPEPAGWSVLKRDDN